MSCIFCKIAAKEIKSVIVHESDKTIAFEDIAPQAPVHVVVIPKKHVSDMEGLKSTLADIFETIAKVSGIKNINRTGYRVVMNNGKDAGQAVDHMHFHVLGGRGMAWPPG